ncbi:hypothetical protein H4R20_000229 [Coemansia guatemalensis]|uniref:Coiled-coil domain-containing protein 43 n=1 Tax=Coemansia guatemalensis TaxID=2761395 RepID=A0A9W8I1W8_9FUNG|nr:hypothetical protein H4R20_000229 [Coemansia guatemalensis]
MSQYLTAELAAIGVDDEAIVEYCVGFLTDTSMSAKEKQEAIVEYLEAATESNLVSGIVSKAIALQEDQSAQNNVALEQQAKRELAIAQEREREELLRDVSEATAKKQEKTLTAEERRRREGLINRYELNQPQIIENKDGEAEIVYSEDKKTSAHISSNDNAQLVSAKQAEERKSAKAAHQKKVLRDKELEKKRHDEEQEKKRRTMKREKRRM